MPTTNQVLLSAKTSIRYEGKRQSLGQQFYASPDDAKRFVDSGQAERVTDAMAKGTVEPDTGAEAGETSGTEAVQGGTPPTT